MLRVYPPDLPPEIKKILIRARRELTPILKRRAQDMNMTPERQRALNNELDAAAARQAVGIAKYFAS